jgi:acyl carrier protein
MDREPAASSIEEVRTKLRTFIGRELLRGQDEGLRDDTPLLELGVVDSMGIVLLTRFLEKELRIVVPPEDLTADNFANIEALARLVVTRTNPASPVG